MILCGRTEKQVRGEGMKRIWWIGMLLFMGLFVSGCERLRDEGPDEPDELTVQLKAIYDKAVAAEAFAGTYEEWLESVRGPRGAPGEDGRTVFLRIAEGHIQWQHEDEDDWTDLIALTALVGPQGEKGSAVVMRVGDTHIQWRYDDSDSWEDLIGLDELIGLPGADGVDGKTVTLRVSAGYIQWSYEGEETWTDLVELASLTGADGADGREVHFRTSVDHIQWRYDGETTWNDLVSLASLRGPRGFPGSAGADGREIILRVAEDHIQWAYEDEGTWTDLIGLAALIGEKGEPGEPGADGEDGVGIETIDVNADGDLVVTLTDATLINLGRILDVHVVTFLDDDDTLLHVETVFTGDGVIGPSLPEREGYDFLGWDEAPEEITADMTVRALYEPRQVSIRFETGTGSVTESITQAAFSVVEAPESPSKPHHHFGGWYADRALNEPFVFTNMPTTDVTVYARWIPRLDIGSLKHMIDTSANHRVRYEALIDLVPAMTYELRREGSLYALDYHDLEDTSTPRHRFNMYLFAEPDHAGGYLECDDLSCWEHQEMTLAVHEEILSYFTFTFTTLLPETLKEHWFTRDDNLYELQADYFDEVLVALGYDTGTDALSLYRIGLEGDGFMIEINVSAAGEVHEKTLHFDHEGLVDIDLPEAGFCATNAFGLLHEIVDGEATITGYEGFSSVLVLPETLAGVPLTAIAAEAFKESDISRIHANDALETIGASAFEGSQALEKVTFGAESQLMHIGEEAFRDTTALTTIVLPVGVSDIGPGAFRGTEALASFLLPDALTYVPEGMFFAGGIQSIHIPAPVTEIRTGAFTWSELREITFAPDSQLEIIGADAFGHTLRTYSPYVVLPDSLTTIGYQAFQDTMGVTIFIPASVVNVTREAFYYNFGMAIWVEHEELPDSWSPFWREPMEFTHWGADRDALWWVD